MNEQTTSPQNSALQRDKEQINRLLMFFALVYVVEGLGQVVGLIAQPLNYYLKEVEGWTPVQITAFITLFNLPWIIKPVYGLVSDFLPLFGYRRKSYLLLANIVAAIGFFWLTQLTTPSDMFLPLMLTAYAMAISSTLCGAVLVETGQQLNASGDFVNQQWLWFNIAAMAAAIIGGLLVQYLAPGTALHAAAAIVGLAPLAAVFGIVFLIHEPKIAVNVQGLKSTFAGLVSAFKRRELWIITIFLFLYFFSPGLTTPLYFTLTDSLKFSQAYIGILGSIASAGWVVAALLYHRLFDELTLKNLLNISIALGTLTTAAYVFLSSEISAAIIYFCSGFSAMLATVATVTLAADYCPQRAEGFAFAVMMSIINLATTLADNVGSYLFSHVFDNKLTPLVLISAGFTAFAFILVPLLRLGNKRQGEAAAGTAFLE